MKNWIKTVLYTPKHSRPTDENILRLLLPSFAGIVICMVCLAGATWAWFTASITTHPQTITAANYNIEVSIDPIPESAENGGYTLAQNQSYTIKLTAGGTAQSGGYCMIQTGETKWHTARLKPDEALTFTLIPEADAVYTFTAVWGSYSGEVNITEGCTIENQTVTPLVTGAPEEQQSANNGETVYLVQSGDTLSEIAQQYDGISADEIAAYNGLENAEKIQIGQEIRIPAADYEIPEKSVSGNAVTDSSKEKALVSATIPAESSKENASSAPTMQNNVISTDE